MRRTNLNRALLTAAAAGWLLLSASAAGAASCSGACGSLGANGDVVAPPTGAATYGWISTYGGMNGVGQLASVGGTDGSTFTTSAFNAKAGDTLQYYFNYVTSDGQDGAGQFIYEDYTSVQLVDAASGTPVAMLFNARTEPTGLIVPGASLPPISPGVTLDPATVPITLGTGAGGGPVWSPLGSYSGQCWGPGCGFTGWVKSSYQIPTDGSYQLVFGVTNWGDTIYDSGLAFTGISIGGNPIEDSVPEPATWAAMLLGFAGVGASIRARRAKASPA